MTERIEDSEHNGQWHRDHPHPVGAAKGEGRRQNQQEDPRSQAQIAMLER